MKFNTGEHMQGRELILFVGHGKTGTTYCQGLLAHNAQRLADHNIFYPLPPARPNGDFTTQFTKKSARGNHELLKRETPLEGVTGDGPIVLHSEHFFGPLIDVNSVWLQQMQDFCHLNGIAKVRTILMVRDPIDFCVSARSQRVGRPEEEDKDLFSAKQQLHFLITTKAYLEQGLDLPGYTVEVFNYSRWAKRLKTLLSNVLGVPELILEDATHLDRNRSIRAPEFALLEAVQEYDETVGTQLKLAMKLGVPVPKEGYYVPPLEAQERTLDKNRDIIAEINALIPVSEKLLETLRDPQEGQGPYTLDREWFTAMGHAIGTLMQDNQFHLLANQAQVALLTTSSALLQKEIAEVEQQLPIARGYIDRLSKMNARGRDMAVEMSQSWQLMSDQLAKMRELGQ